MGFLRTLFWVLLAGIAVAFALNNWTTVPISLWAGLIADVNLPLLLVTTFLVGFVPMLAVHLTTRWRLRQRLIALEQTLAELHRATAPAASPTAPAMSITRGTEAEPLPMRSASPGPTPSMAPPLMPSTTASPGGE